MSIKTINTKLKLVIEHDNDCESPREWDSFGKMICFHDSYNLGDKHNYSDARDMYQDICYEVNPYRASILENAYENDFISYEQAIESLIKAIEKDVVILPLYLYDHSGITMNTTGFACRWDSGKIGITYATRRDLEKEGLNIDNEEDREKAISILNSEVEVYDTYIRGDVYGAIIVEYDEEYDNEYDTIKSCWGFFGSDIKDNGIMEFLKGNDCEYLLDKGNSVYDYIKY